MTTKKTTFDRKGHHNETAEVLELRKMRLEYYNCLALAISEATDDETLVRLTAEKCRQCGLPEEPCVLRTASFIATTNSPTPLTDPTGSRRYICCPVGGIIDTEPTVNYRQLYAQALFELRHGAAYYPSREEEQRMEAHNAQFQQMKKAELTLTEFFAPAERNKASLMTLSEVERSLHGRISAADMPSFRELSAALSQHFQPGAVDGRRGWYMRPKE